ncbi:MAG: STAS domain-containing protein [Methylocystaceae bacterium]|nr:STAS domain-containing protein [Methylocystaceae bacterium]
MEYSLLDKGANKHVVFYGNIRPSSRPKFLAIADEFPKTDKKKWILEVDQFEYIDSAGLGLLIELHEKAQKSDISLAITGAAPLVKRMFDLSKFETLFEIID